MRSIIAMVLLGLAGLCAPLHAGEPTMRVLVFGDPQVKSLQDLDYFRRDIVQPLHGTHTAQLGISLGDIVDDVPPLLPAVRRETARLGIPWLYVPGNHDVDPGATDDASSLASFRREIGPDTVIHETALANVVVLDDVIALPGRKPAYIGGLREDQFAMLEARLPQLRKDRLLVLALHIPLFEDAGKDSFRDEDRARLFALVRDFPHVLVLSAHSHAQRHVFHDARSGWHGAAPLHEYNVGTTSGAYWSGRKDAAGIPDSTMADGTPNGYAVLEVKTGGAYSLAWHNARDAADTQIGLHAPKVLRRGAYPGWGVYANVYMGMDDSRVEYRIDDGEWKPMQRFPSADPALLAENMRDDLADQLRGYDRSPEAEPSPHLWRGALPTHLEAGEHRVEVRAFDRWRGEARATTTYQLHEFDADSELPLRSQAALEAYLVANQGQATPLDLLPSLTRQRFLSSLRFGSKGLGGFGVDDLATELTPAEIERVLALFDAAEFARMVPSRHPDGPPRWRGDASSPGRIETSFDVLYRLNDTGGQDPGDLQYKFARMFGDLPLRPKAVARLSDRESIYLLRSLELVLPAVPNPDDAKALQLVVADLQRRGIAQSADLRMVYDTLLKARHFDEARRFARAHAQAELPAVPAMVDGIGGRAAMPTVWRASGDGAAMTRTPIDLSRSVILVTAGCHFSLDAAEDIARDRLLGPLFAERAHWLVLPPGHESLDAIREWNRRFPQMQAEPIHDRAEWSALLPDQWQMPVFFIVRDGRIVERIAGWPRNPAENRQPLIDALVRTGMLKIP
jgi:hypothetical protein